MTPFRSRGRRSKPSSRAASPTRSSSSASQSNHSCASMPSSPATPASGAKVGFGCEAFPFGPLGASGPQTHPGEVRLLQEVRGGGRLGPHQLSWPLLEDVRGGVCRNSPAGCAGRAGWDGSGWFPPRSPAPRLSRAPAGGRSQLLQPQVGPVRREQRPPGLCCPITPFAMHGLISSFVRLFFVFEFMYFPFGSLVSF